MPTTATASGPALIWGDDEFAVKQRARQQFRQWSEELGGADEEILDAQAGNSGDALQALGRLREAMQTFPFFGSGKVIWFQNCNFLGEDRVSGAQAVSAALSDLADELKRFDWRGVRLLISAGKVDKRKGFYKVLEKLGPVEHFPAWSIDDRGWTLQAEALARRELKAAGKQMAKTALAELIQNVGPDAQQLVSEITKLTIYVGDRPEITPADVQAIVARNKHARAFALADALGERDLPRLLRTLDEELWEMRAASQRSAIGLLYGLITKVRVMLFLKEMLGEGTLRMETDYDRFKAQLERVPAGLLPDDKRFNPLAMNAYMLFKALPQTRHYTSDELIRAMELLLDCNRQLVSSSLDEALIVQQTLVEIVSRKP